MLTYIQKDLVEPLVGLDLLLRRQNVRFDLEKSFAVIDFEDLKNQDNGVTFPWHEDSWTSDSKGLWFNWVVKCRTSRKATTTAVVRIRFKISVILTNGWLARGWCQLFIIKIIWGLSFHLITRVKQQHLANKVQRWDGLRPLFVKLGTGSPLARTRWVQSTFSSHFLSPVPLINLCNINNFSAEIFLGNAGIRTQGYWVRGKYATSVAVEFWHSSKVKLW